MQSVNLSADEPPDDLVAAQAAAEGVEGHEATIKRLCANALASDVVKRAAVRRHWREVYVGVPHEQYGVLEGYIDLLYEDDDGLVIVDYKTDAFASLDELDEKVERYAVQLRAYADAVTTATAQRVVRSQLVFAAGDAPTVRTC
jgi:ATP-dependent exoDNAse (exonuclease V) beta subunit